MKDTTKEAVVVEEVETIKKGTQVYGPERRSVIVPKVTLLFNNIMTAAHNNDAGMLVSTELSSRQVVVAVGENSQVKVGDWIEINVDMFPKETLPGKHDKGNVIHIHPPFVTVGNTKYLFMTDRHVKYIYDR